jgi:hypothetical protein
MKPATELNQIGIDKRPVTEAPLSANSTTTGRHSTAAETGGGKTRREQGYGHAWDKLRRVILARDSYLCQQ